MNLSDIIICMKNNTDGTEFLNTYVLVVPHFGITPIFTGTVQELIDAYRDSFDFGSAGAKSWTVVEFKHIKLKPSDDDKPFYNKSIRIKVI